MLPQPNPMLRALEAYIPGEQPQEPGFVKLNTNEFPYPASPAVIEAIRSCASDDVRLYPSPRCEKLRRKLAEYHGLKLDDFLVGNGSDEILRVIIAAYGGPGRLGAMVNPTYTLYQSLFQASGTDYKVFLLDNLTGLSAELHEAAWDLLLLPIPNAPLGNLFPIEALERLLRKGNLLVIDEAYVDFSDGPSHLELLAKYDNLILTRTFSKSFGLAGLRAGYAIAHPAIIEQLSSLADSYNVNRITQAAALAALESADYYKANVNQIKSDRAWLAGELARRGFEVEPSHANFLFASRSNAKKLYEALKARKILVRYFDNPLLPEGFRITIGTRPELETLLSAIDQES